MASVLRSALLSARKRSLKRKRRLILMALAVTELFRRHGISERQLALRGLRDEAVDAPALIFRGLARDAIAKRCERGTNTERRVEAQRGLAGFSFIVRPSC